MTTYTPSKSAIRDQLHASLLRLSNLINAQAIQGAPEGVVAGTRGDLVIDTSSVTIWIKSTGAPGGAQSTTGWIALGSGADGVLEYGSVGWTIPFLVGTQTQVGSGAGMVDVQGDSTLDPAAGFVSDADNQLTYQGAGGVFFVEAEINIQNPNGEETTFGFQLTLNGSPVVSSQRTLISSANEITPVTTFMQTDLSAGDVLGAQVGSLGGGLDTTATYFRLRAHRVGALP